MSVEEQAEIIIYMGAINIGCDKSLDLLDTSPVDGTIEELQPIHLKPITNNDQRDLWDDVVSRYHYLGHRKMPGRRLKYLVLSGERLIGAISFRAASINLEVRDSFIGWSYEKRRANLDCLANNNRFLILPWVSVPNLGSYLLGKVSRRISADWKDKYGSELLLLETFIDPDKFAGTIYMAANWTYLGETKGYTKDAQTFSYHGKKKEVFVYPLRDDFRQVLDCQRAPIRRQYTFRRERVKMLNHSQDWQPDFFEKAGINEDNIEQLAEELEEFHRLFSSCFNHSKQNLYSLTYLRGLVSNLDKKTVEAIALRFLDKSAVRYLQKFMKDSPWNDNKMLQICQEKTLNLIGTNNGMVTIDSSEMAKRGSKSVGVARQYCGRLGKVENCQSGVFIGYSSDKGYALLDQQLYMPKKWFSSEYDALREECMVPEGLQFMTKTEIALSLLEELSLSEITAKWIGMDSAFGRSYQFRKTVGEDLYYLASVPGDTKVWLDTPQTDQDNKPLTPSIRVDELAKSNDIEWKDATLNEGARGIITTKVAFLRVIESNNNEVKEEVWLVMRKLKNGKIKYFLSNAPKDIPKEELLKALIMRWPIEQSFEVCKSELGMADYEMRSWPAYHRHITHVIMAMLFLLMIQYKYMPPAKEEREDDQNDQDNNYTKADNKSHRDTEHNSYNSNNTQRTPMLSLVRLKKLISAAIDDVIEWATTALERAKYHAKRNYISYVSRKQWRLIELLEQGFSSIETYKILVKE